MNGSPATITIETCEDPGDWTTAIGGIFLQLLGNTGGLMTGSIYQWSDPDWVQDPIADPLDLWAVMWNSVLHMLASSGDILYYFLLSVTPYINLPTAYLTLFFHHRWHICILAGTEGCWLTGWGHTGIPTGAGGNHERSAAASAGPTPAAPR